MRGFDAVVSIDGSRRNTFLLQQLIDFDPRAGAGFAIDETPFSTLEIGKRPDAQGIARRNDQALLTPQKTDQLVLARLEHFLESFLSQRALTAVFANMKTSQQTFAARQGGDAFKAAAKLQIEMQLRLARHEVLQSRQGQIMTCVQRQHMRG